MWEVVGRRPAVANFHDRSFVAYPASDPWRGGCQAMFLADIGNGRFSSRCSRRMAIFSASL
jgi:hypothetical protein